jgi:phage repressor protein C with HTH and peptisase S24 domain
LPVAQIGFDPARLNRLTAAGADELNLVQVDGDSMSPTLLPGDDILVDRSDGEARVRDGIYVLRMEDSLLVKRLTLHPVTRRVTVQSDNPAYADWPDLALSDIKLIGRVIWTGRRVASRLSSSERVNEVARQSLPPPRRRQWRRNSAGHKQCRSRPRR